MIAARLAGGNLFLPFWVEEIFGGGFLEHSEQLGALGFFLVGDFLGEAVRKPIGILNR